MDSISRLCGIGPVPYFGDALSRDELEQLFTLLDRVRTHFDAVRHRASDDGA